MLVKRDAIEDGIDQSIISDVENHPSICDIQAMYGLFSFDDAYNLYLPEMFDDDTPRRRYLMNLGIRSMVGENIFLLLRVQTENHDNLKESMSIVNKIKGKAFDSDAGDSIRRKYRVDIDDDIIDSDLRDRLIVRNRVHSPDTIASYRGFKNVMQDVVSRKV